MEPAAQPENRSLLSKNLLIFPPLIFLTILIGMGGYYVGLNQGIKVQQPSQAQPEGKTETPTVTQEELPISLSLLKNPIIYQWRGTVKGTLVAKDEDSITIRDEQGNSIVIHLPVLPAGEKLDFIVKRQGGETTLLPLENIPLNASVQSEFIVPQDNEDILVGTDFIYFESP